MFAQVLYIQWKWARTELFMYVLAAFLVPVIIIKIGYTMVDSYAISNVLNVMSYAGVFFGSLALLCAFGMAWRPYIADAQLKHVGPLSLPVPWATFVRLRFLAGATLLLIPTIAVWLGGVIATAATTIPPTLHAYPGGIAIRFLFASLVGYSAAFLLQYVAGKHAVRVAIGIFFAIILIELAANMLGYDSVMLKVWNLLTTWPGPFAIFSARWMLVDV
jgi:hypothetical protein